VLLLRSEAITGPHDPEFKIKSLARKLSILVTAMANPQPAAQKSHFTHAERYKADLDPEVWLSQFQRMLDDLPQGKQDPKHLHVQSLYDPAYFPQLDSDEKKAAEAIRNVSLPRSKGASHRKIGDMPAGISWDGPHKGTGFDPMPNEDEWKVL
jgi:hypothetical protein